MRRTPGLKFKLCILIMLLTTLAPIVAAGDNYYPRLYLLNRHAPPAQTSFPADLSMPRGNIQHNGIFANGGTLSFQGQLWQKTQKDFVGSTPIMAGDLLVFAVAGEGLRGVDIKTGDTKWLKQGKGYWPQDVLAYRDHSLYYWWDEGLHALDMKTLQEKWVLTNTNQIQFRALAVPAFTLYFGYSPLLHAIDSRTGQTMWSAKFADWVESAVALDNNVAYFTAAYDRTPPGGDDLQEQVNLYAADAQTGQELWRFEPQGTPEMPASVEPPIVGDGVVYCATREDAWLGPGRVYALDGSSGAELWQQPIDNLGTPELLAYSSGLLYVANDASSYYGGDATLRALDGKTGKQRWSFVKGDYMSAPVISGQTVYITAGQNGHNETQLGDKLYALDRSTGKLLHEVQLIGAITNPVSIDRGTIYYTSSSISYVAPLANWVTAIR